MGSDIEIAHEGNVPGLIDIRSLVGSTDDVMSLLQAETGEIFFSLYRRERHPR